MVLYVENVEAFLKNGKNAKDSTITKSLHCIKTLASGKLKDPQNKTPFFVLSSYQSVFY